MKQTFGIFGMHESDKLVFRNGLVKEKHFQLINFRPFDFMLTSFMLNNAKMFDSVLCKGKIYI